MRPIERIDRILELIGKLWHKHHDMRLGQLLENYVFSPEEMWNDEDDDTEELLRKALLK